jgi:lipase chaperone LimK
MMRPADAKKTAYKRLSFAVAGVAIAAAAAVTVWYFNAPAGAPRAGVRIVAASAPFLPPMRAAQPGSSAAAAVTPLPVSLAGTTPPRLPLDARGHLRKTRGVRDFFDYFLTAQNEIPASALDALVRRQIAAQLDGTATQAEALDVWQRYQSYRAALARLAPLAAPPATSESGPGRSSEGELDAMQAALDERASVASRTLGDDWNEAFFGSDWRRGHAMLERLRIARDPTLTAEQKAARLQALDQSLPDSERRAVDRAEQARQGVDAVAKLEEQGMSIDQLRAKATQALGPQAAERIVQMRQGDDAWRAKYADYTSQRGRIDAMGLPAAERDAQIAQLRERTFANSGERLRAASLDRGAGQ